MFGVYVPGPRTYTHAVHPDNHCNNEECDACRYVVTFIAVVPGNLFMHAFITFSFLLV